MADIEPIYRALVEGTADDTPLATVARPLLRLALERARSPLVQDRVGALRVASALGRTHGLAVTRELLNDVDPLVRRYAFNQAVAARRGGIVLLRLAASSRDPELVAEALRLLAVVMDRGSTALARRLTADPDPAVRAAAARLVGLVAGPSARVELARLADDADPDVKAAVEEAMARLGGAGEPGRPGQWWDDDASDALPAPPVPTADPVAAEPEATAEEAEAEEPEAAAEVPDPPTVPLPAPEETALVPLAADPEEGPVGEGIPLPSALPTEARALLRLLGQVASADQPPVLGALEGQRQEVVLLLARHRPGGDEALGRGLGIAARRLGGATWLTRLRPLLVDPQGSVRQAALHAFGELGSGSTIPQVTRLLDDPDAAVRQAAVEAVEALCARTGRPDVGRQWLGARLADPDPAVCAAARRALGLPDPEPGDTP